MQTPFIPDVLNSRMGKVNFDKTLHQIHFSGHKGFIKLALREEVPIVPIISHGAHETLIVLADFYQQVQQLHQWGLSWPTDGGTGVFPIYLGLPWGIGIGPIPNFPLPVQLHTRVCPPIVFRVYSDTASRDRDYVDECYEQVCIHMQAELDELVRKKELQISRQLESEA